MAAVAQDNLHTQINKLDTQLIGKALELDRSGEVLVINTRDWPVIYCGPVNDWVGYETQRNDTKHNYLADALAAVVA